MTLFLYDLLFTSFLILYVPYSLLRCLFQKRLREKLSHRMGWIPTLQKRRPVWIHAASVGEVICSIPLFKRMKEEFPDVPTPKELGLKVGTKGPLGIVGPRGLPPEVVKTLAETFRKATQDPRFVKFMENMHTHIVYKGPEEFLAELRDYDEWSVEIMRRIGLIK